MPIAAPGQPAERPRRRWLRSVPAALALACAGLPGARANPSPRIAHVMSFDSPWRWTDGQLEGFREGLGLPAAEIAVFQMDTKRHASDEAKAERGRLARAFVDSFRPDLLYASDDDAQQHVTRHYLGSRLPLVFSGVNRDPGSFGFDSASNVTGVLEREHVAETLRLLRALVPNLHRLVVLSDHGPYWDAVIRRVQEGAAAVGGLTLTRVVRTQRFEDYCQAVLAAQGQADALLHLGILTLVAANGRPVPYQAVQRWVVENSRLPDASFWMDRVHHGTLASVTVSEIEQGRVAGFAADAAHGQGSSGHQPAAGARLGHHGAQHTAAAVADRPPLRLGPAAVMQAMNPRGWSMGRWGLRRRIAVVAGLGLVLAILASMLASRALATAQLRLAQQDRAQAIAEGLAVQLQRILALGLRIDEVQGFEAQGLEALTAHQGLAYVLVLSPAGVPLAAVAAGGEATGLATEVHAALARHGARPPALSDGSHAVAVPVRDFTQSTVAQVVVGFPQALLDEAEAALLRTHAAVGLATLVVALGLLWLAMSHLVTQPVARLVAAMNGIDSASAGALAVQPRVHHDPDLVAIDEAVRRLLVRIAGHETELTRARDEALQASRMKSEFLAVMSHELRTPLNAVLGMAQLLERTPLDDRQRRYVGHVREGGALLLAVVNDVLDLASIEAGRLQLRPQPVALAPLLQSLLQLHEALARSKGLALRLALDAALPAWVLADPQRLRQMLGNLLSNALKFTEQGEVLVSAAPAPGGVQLAVRDTGPGIPEAFQPHLFEAFRQGDAGLQRQHSGTGLGLAIVRRLARAMGGEVSADSVPGCGATFTLLLPLPVVDAPPPEA